MMVVSLLRISDRGLNDENLTQLKTRLALGFRIVKYNTFYLIKSIVVKITVFK